jgi:hypothetical protein
MPISRIKTKNLSYILKQGKPLSELPGKYAHGDYVPSDEVRIKFSAHFAHPLFPQPI